MAKLDKIPKNFQQRYLLTDLGWFQEELEQLERLAIDPHSMIPYWKPEVAVRLVTDFSRYPVNYLPRGLEQHLVSGKRVTEEMVKRGEKKFFGAYKPAIHADEIGLTSDK